MRRTGGAYHSYEKGCLHSRTAEPHGWIRVIRKVVPSVEHRSLHTRARTIGRLFQGERPQPPRLPPWIRACHHRNAGYHELLR